MDGTAFAELVLYCAMVSSIEEHWSLGTMLRPTPRFVKRALENKAGTIYCRGTPIVLLKSVNQWGAAREGQSEQRQGGDALVERQGNRRCWYAEAICIHSRINM